MTVYAEEPTTAQECMARARAVLARRNAGWPSVEVVRRRLLATKEAEMVAEIRSKDDEILSLREEIAQLSSELAALKAKRGVDVFSISQIKQEVSRRFDVSIIDIESARHLRPHVMARQAVMYLARELTRRSLTEIGRCVGRRDHTTVLHGIQKIGDLIENDEILAAKIADVREELTGFREAAR